MSVSQEGQAARQERRGERTGRGIAIVGLAALMPEAAGLDAYWSNILHGVDCIRDLPEGRWRPDLYLAEDPGAPDRAYAARGGFLPPVPFDPLAFGLPPKALASLDSSQLLGLVAAKAALEDAGCPPGTVDHARTGVVLGLAGTTMKSLHDLRGGLETTLWERVLRDQGLDSERVAEIAAAVRRHYPDWEENSFPGFLANVVAGRIANRFDLGGPAFAVDAACASSLCAVGLAMDALAAGRADLMLTGGLDTDNGLTAFLSFSKTPALSPSGAVRAFDAAADGTLISEGVGLLVLKRLADAERDGDRIYAVLGGYGATSDGRSKSIYAPRAEGQVRAVRDALEAAGVTAAEIGLVEAHATGTAVGDAVEFEALETVFSAAGAPARGTALGSVKSQIGHTKAAAGAASLIKAALALHYKALPPTLNVTRPNPRLEPEGSPLYLNTRTRPWAARADRPRRAGVSAFGFGGANLHVVLEEAPQAVEPLPLAASPVGVIVEAASPEALAERCRDLAARLAGGEGRALLAELVAAPTPAPERPRLGFVAADPAEAARVLDLAAETLANRGGQADWSLPAGVHYRPAALPEAAEGALVALFPGQGSQYVGMGGELTIAFPQVRTAFERLDRRYESAGLTPLSSVVFPPPDADPEAAGAQDSALRRTLYAQGAVGALSLGLLRVLESSGFRADFAAGHSFGELTALHAAGALGEDGFLDLVLARGQALTPPEDLSDAGTLLAVEADRATVETELAALGDLAGLRLANANAPGQTVIGGPLDTVEAAAERLAGRGHSVVRLPVAAAFHTPCVGYAEQPWRRALAGATFAAPRCRVASNRSGGFHDGESGALCEGLAAQPFEPVLFQDDIEAIYQAGGRVFVEVGPRAVLTGLVGATLGERPHLALALDPGRGADAERRLRGAILQLRVAGLALREPRPVKLPSAPAPLPEHGALVWIDGESVGAVERRRDAEQALAELARRRPLQARPTPDETPPPAHRPEEPAVDRTANPAAGPALLDPSLLDRALDLEEATLAAHRDFLALQGDQARLLAELQAKGADGRLVERLAAQQAEVTRLHADFLAGQRGHARRLLGGGESPAAAPAPVAPPLATRIAAGVPARTAVEAGAPAPAAAAGAAAPADSPEHDAAASGPSGMTAEAILPRLLEIVGEATGYPADFLDPAMDLEADLGIDSIKRVEILAALRDALGEPGRRAGPLPKSALGGAVSLQGLAELLARHVASASEPASAAPAEPGATAQPATPAAPAARPEAATERTGLTQLSRLLAGIVADKTGYPEDMLGPDLDIEADLGIDSIKRVEILSALRDALGDAVPAWPDRLDLAGARTLGAVARLLAGAAAGVASDAATAGALPANQNERREAQREGPAEGRAAGTATGTLAWHALPAAPAEPVRLAGAVAILGECDAVTVAIAERLEAAGATPVVLQVPPAPATETVEPPETLHCLPLADAGRATLDAALTRVERLFGPLGGALFRWPATGPAAGPAAAGERGGSAFGDTALLAAALDLASLLDARLPDAAGAAFLSLVPAGAAPAAAGLRGLVRCLAAEWPSVGCRALELDGALPPAEIAKAVLDELGRRDEAPVVRLDGKRRQALGFEPLVLPPDGPLPIGPGDLVLVSGGGRGITADCAEALARASGCCLLLLGRTALDAREPAWAEGVADGELRGAAIAALSAEARPTPRQVEEVLAPLVAARAVRSRLAALREKGIEADYRAVDVADAAAVAALVAESGPVAGLVHGAGALADRRIGDKRAEDFDRVFRPKVEGLRALLDALDPGRLKLLALFSSTAAAFGNAGQSDYAMANALLDETAARLAQDRPACRVVSLAWGPWAGGMVTPELARRFAERGIRPIETAEGQALFLAALRQRGTAHLVIGDDLSGGAAAAGATRRFSLADTPELADHVIDGRPVLPAAWPLAWMLAAAEARGLEVGAVEDFRVLKGVILEDGESAPLTLSLSELDGAWQASVADAAGEEPANAHYRARLIPGSPQAGARSGRLETTAPGESQGIDAQAYLEGPIAYGPAFRGVLAVERLDGEGVRLAVRLPASPAEGARNPLAYDIATHALLVWLQAERGAGCLPSRVARIVWQAGPAEGALTVEARIRSLDAERLVADLALFDGDGAALLRIEGFEGVVVDREHPLFQRAAARRSA